MNLGGDAGRDRAVAVERGEMMLMMVWFVIIAIVGVIIVLDVRLARISNAITRACAKSPEDAKDHVEDDRELLSHHDEAYEQVMTRAETAEAKVARLERSLEEERDDRSISVLIASVIWAENRITQLERSMEWFADPYNYHTGDIPTNRESDLIREHTARARKAQVDDVRNRAAYGVGLRSEPGE